MKHFDLSGYSPAAKIFFCLTLCLGLAAFGLGAFGILSLTISQLAVLAVALSVAVAVNVYQYKIPNTRADFPVREIIAFWGIIWLGLPGGVLLAAGAAAAGYVFQPKDKTRRLFGGAASIVSAAAAALVFYFVLRQADFNGAVVADQAVEVVWLAAAIFSAALVMLAASSGLKTLFYKLADAQTAVGQSAGETFIALGAKYLLMVGGALLTYFLFEKFGLWFGLVVVPLIVLAHIAYRMHVQRLAQKTSEISEANRIHVATVEALATAIDARDQVGIGHVRRTQIFAVGIGEVLGLPEDEIEALRTAALLHDIGKLAVPDHILNKPGRLTPAEMEKMKIHSVVGASILEKIKFPYPVVPTVKYHHEMWDGSGYPEGLKKDELPLTARILSIADAYDTLRGARPYRKAISREEARRFILSGAGTQFDPKLTDVFMRNVKQFELEIDRQNLSYNFDGEVEEDLFNSIEPNSSEGGYVAQIKRANREVFALYELARIFSSALSLEETLALFVKKVGELVPFDSCVVYLMEKNQEIARAAHAEGLNAAELMNKVVRADEGATGYVLKKRQSVNHINPALDFSFYQSDFIQAYTAMASLPLITEEKMIGAISLYSCELENYEDEHMRLLETISRIAADAVFKSLRHADAESRALTDPMTGLPNARCLQSQFETEVARARRNGTEFQVLMLDLDGFKAVNDTFGHKTGDLLLKGVSKAMRDQLRDYDFLARYAGDEFVVIAPETPEKDVAELCERLENAVRGYALALDDSKFARVGVSLGAACYPRHGESLDQIVIAADKQMYAVKAAHKKKAKAEQERKAQAQKPAEPILKVPESVIVPEKPITVGEEMLVVELDENSIISSAIN